MTEELVWKVQMSDNPSRRAIMNVWCVRADSLVEATDKAISLEADFAADLSKEEGETIEPAGPLKVELLCAIDA
jgi:hypothetical protein